MKNKKFIFPRLTIVLSVVLLLLLTAYIPPLQAFMADAMAEILKSIPFAGAILSLLGALGEGASLNAAEINIAGSVWNDILKSLAIIVIFMLVEKLINSIFEHEIDKVLALFASYFICSTVISVLLDTYISDLLGTDILAAVIVLASLILFFAVSAVLICLIYDKSLIAGIFYVVFKVLFDLLGIAFTSAFSVIIYGAFWFKKPLLILFAVAVVAAFCVVKFVERLFCGK